MPSRFDANTVFPAMGDGMTFALLSPLTPAPAPPLAKGDIIKMQFPRGAAVDLTVTDTFEKGFAARDSSKTYTCVPTTDPLHLSENKIANWTYTVWQVVTIVA